ncbi:serine--tRNA ligase [Streptomyces sp. ISL-86]|uniref:serine--tRNA ligase n=1 Tax=Streptomyces sp. ISL-86 TaxID=2819187 RepID=UPI001BE9A4A6|nr:serine--tRNA ligase [Streptomyces sp. ISL-86]MBT2453654.1 serine--tRNA ligase [Streptomyces sp. ISL-86]
MIDLKFILQNPDEVAENCARRGYDVDIERITRLDRERRDVLTRLEAVRHQVTVLGREWKSALDQDEHRRKANELKAERGRLEQELEGVETQLQELASWLPNMLDPRVPVGGEEKNVVVRTVGELTKFDFAPRSHEEIGRLTATIDIPRGVNVAGSRFYLLMNEAVQIRYALTDLFVKRARAQGFDLVSPPYLARRETLFASGYLPFQDKDNFVVNDADLSLIGTSEQSLLGMHIGETLTELPVMYLGDSMCFRTEAGSYGRDTAGILRVHQFHKLEQLIYCHPDESEKYHQLCLENEEWLMRELGIPCQVVLTGSKDLGAPGRMKYDTEAWLPFQERYRETTSNTNMGDFQTRRGRIRYKVGGEKGFPHTISATGFCDRLIIAIMENYQQEDGAVRVPELLVPYLGTDVIPVRPVHQQRPAAR